MKLPFDIDLKIVFRVLLPGVVVAFALLPLLNGVLDMLTASAYAEAGFTALALLGGWVVLTLDMPIYMLYEGRRFWPTWLRKAFLRGEQQRLASLLAIDERYRKKDARVSQRQWNEAWFDIRRFPIDAHARPEARYPTRLGNLIASYESYPSTRYGIDAIFVWPRLWASLDKDLREALDSSQAQADSALYTSFTFYFLGILYALYTFLRLVGVTGIGWAGQAPLLLLAAIALIGFIGGYALYRLDLYPQAVYGDLFVSAFDVAFPKLDFSYVLKTVAEITGDGSLDAASSREKMRVVWRYLQYYMVRAPGSNKSIRVPEYEQQQKKP